MAHFHSTVETAPDQAVEVRLLGSATRVMLLSGADYRRYQEGLDAEPAAGGQVTSTPVILPPPHPGEWHVVVEDGGLAGVVSASVRVVSVR